MLYQFGDDFSYIHGSHTLRFGLNFRRDLLSDHLGANTAGTALATLGGFYNGAVDRSFSQTFGRSTFDVPAALYNLGWYAQDDWRVNSKLNLTLTARFEHNSNPICVTDCFGRLTSPFEQLNHDVTIPYNSAIDAQTRQAFFQSTAVSFVPRIGFAWTPFADAKTVVRGGFGIFAQGLPGLLTNTFANNPPEFPTYVVTGMLSPAVTGNVFSAAAADNTAFASGFSNGATLAQLQADVPGFSPPSMYTAAPSTQDGTYREWNLEVQHALSANMGIDVDYVGNYGYHEAFQVRGVNAYCPVSACPNGYSGLPAAPIDPRFGTVTELQTTGESNYNGVTVSFRRNMSHGLLVTANYTYGHALDDVSNGGLEAFGFGTASNILFAQNPSDPQANYGNSDYDVRHSFNLSYVWQIPAPIHQEAMEQILGGWTVSGTVFARTGLPFTVVDGNQEGFLGRYNNSGGPIFANFLGGPQPSCGVNAPCLLSSQFAPATSGFGQQERNQFRGPGFFDTDMSIMKNVKMTKLSEQAQFTFGVQLFNLFNHPNFDQPVADISNSQFGTIVSTVNVPSSLLGAFLGGDASPRMVELTAKFSF
jgi:hypothetical protein